MSAASRSEPGQWSRWGAYFSWAGPPAAPKPSAPLLSSSLPLHMRKTLVLSGKIRQHLPRRLVRYVSCKPDVECKCHRPRSRSLSRGCWTTWSSSRCLHHRPQLNSSQKNLNSSGDTDSQPERLLLQRRLEQNQFGSILRCSPCQECWTLWHRLWTSSGTSIFSFWHLTWLLHSDPTAWQTTRINSQLHYWQVHRLHEHLQPLPGHLSFHGHLRQQHPAESELSLHLSHRCSLVVICRWFSALAVQTFRSDSSPLFACTISTGLSIHIIDDSSFVVVDPFPAGSLLVSCCVLVSFLLLFSRDSQPKIFLKIHPLKSDHLSKQGHLWPPMLYLVFGF